MMPIAPKDEKNGVSKSRRNALYAAGALLIAVSVILGTLAYLSTTSRDSSSQGTGGCNPCSGPPLSLSEAGTNSSKTGSTVSTGWANFSITSLPSGLTIGNLALSLENSDGVPVTVAQSSCLPFWAGSAACSTNSLTVAMIDLGTVLLTYDLADSAWGAPGGGSPSTLVTIGTVVSLKVTMTGTDVVLPGSLRSRICAGGDQPWEFLRDRIRRNQLRAATLIRPGQRQWQHRSSRSSVVK